MATTFLLNNSQGGGGHGGSQQQAPLSVSGSGPSSSSSGANNNNNGIVNNNEAAAVLPEATLSTHLTVRMVWRDGVNGMEWNAYCCWLNVRVETLCICVCCYHALPFFSCANFVSFYHSRWLLILFLLLSSFFLAYLFSILFMLSST